MNEHCVLVIEDQEDLAELYESALKDAGYKVRLAFTGEEGLATFDGPARAIRCACAISDAAARLGIRVQAGLHTGECDVMEEKVGGVAVRIGAHVTEQATAGEVLVSHTVKDLVAGSGIRFEDRGSRILEDIPGDWRLFAVCR